MAKQKRYLPKFDGTNFSELMLYISSRCEADPTFGAVKLNKILFYSDFYAYRTLGESITGATYQKLPEGPAPREMLPERRRLIQSDRATLEPRPYFSGVQHRVVPSAKYNFQTIDEYISPQQREVVEEVISFFEGKTAREVSDYSHREPGWNLVDFREDIPYETAWLSTDPPEEDERNLAEDLASKDR
jgi:hypothetical protein